MKITTARTYVSALAVAAMVLSGGVFYAANTANVQQKTYAYTSAENAQDPATAPDSYEVIVPDATLKATLNNVIAQVINIDRKNKGLPQDVVRTPDQKITAGDMKHPANVYGPLTLNEKGFTNIEGLQFLVSATQIDAFGNNISNVAPLRDLPNLATLNLGRNKITDVAPLGSVPNLKVLFLHRNLELVNIAPLKNATSLKTLDVTTTKADLSMLANHPSLESLTASGILPNSAKPNLSQISTLAKLKTLIINSNRLESADVAVIKDTPLLENLNVSGNRIVDLQQAIGQGFTNLKPGSNFTGQTHGINARNNPLIANPLRDLNGNVIPVVETANVKNADADGSLNPNGAYIKLVNTYGAGAVAVDWNHQFTKGAMVNQVFSGKINISYNLPAQDSTNPTITPAQPDKLIARKGKAIDLTDGIVAEDNPGGSGIRSFANDAAAQGLNPANPAKGNYTITYTATDNQGNTATATRQVEITDADALQAKVATVNDALFVGRTADSKQAVLDKKAAAEQMIAKNNATQAQINQALTELDDAINALQTDKQPLTDVLAVFDKRPDYVKTNPAVVTAEAAARTLSGQANPNPADVNRDITALTQAMFAAAKDALNDKITSAELPATTEGMESESVKELQRVLGEVRQLRDQANTSNPPSQEALENAVANLQKAVDALQVDTRKLVAAVTNRYNTEPAHIQQDPAVQTALAEANRVLNDQAKTPSSVDKAARDLIKALEDAKQAEADRQTAARQAFDKAEQDKTASAIADAKTKIAALKDKGTRQTMETELAVIERDYNNAKKALEDIIARAEDPKTTENANDATKQALADQVRLAKALFNSDPSQTDFENMKNDVEQKINELRPDTTALEAVINSVPNESAFVQQDAEVVKKLAAANAIKNNPAATIQQIATAKAELEKAIADARAVEAEQQAEAQRQTEAEAAVVAAEAAKTPDTFTAAQAKIDAVKTDAVKQQLQDRLNAVKQAYQAKKDELKALIDRAKLPETVDGMTKATVDALSDELTKAEETERLANVPQSTIETAVRDLKAALDALQVDKKPLADAEVTHSTQPDHIKSNPAVAAAFRKAQDTRAMDNPPVKQVRDDAKALEDAIKAATKAEADAQQAASDVLQQAADKLNVQLAPGEMPQIDVKALEAEVAKVQDLTKQGELTKRLDDLKQKLADRQKQVDAHKKAEADKKAEAERKAEADRKAKEKAQMDKGGLLSDTGMPVAAPAIGGLGAILAGAWALVRRKRQ